MTITRVLLGCGLLAGAVSLSSVAEAKEDDTPTIVSYGFDGFWTGAQIGLAAGFLSTGSEYETREWRKLVFGAGVGALTGVGLGIALGIIDVGEPPPRTGWLVLRDTGYGVGLGAVVGAAVGALFLIDSGEPKDLLTGASIGTLVGAGLGIGFGLIESAAADRTPPAEPAVKATTAQVRFTLVGSEGSLYPMPALSGTF